ncbi:hypothetical protein [Halomonas elongata]|nr:hypothetical protein [Halomonas elongata]
MTTRARGALKRGSCATPIEASSEPCRELMLIDGIVKGELDHRAEES